ncbi:MAG: phosphoribosyl transferase [Candidatus Yonathbacteria bacterium]|nr:phosphoribosyl transferase [Candidatus Yonathbacteria bacterium]
MTVFKNRIEAGKKLSELLGKFKGTNTIVLALPRGGVVVAREISEALNLPLDIIVTRKIGAPGNDEYAIGAIDLNGNGVWNEYERASVDQTWLKNKIESEKKEANRRFETYRKGKGALDLKNRTVIIVDDGIATGLTMQAAVAYAKHEGAEKIIVAAPVASFESVRALKNTADVRVIETPVFFSAVGERYEDFPQVSDEEVVEVLSLIHV